MISRRLFWVAVLSNSLSRQPVSSSQMIASFLREDMSPAFLGRVQTASGNEARCECGWQSHLHQSLSPVERPQSALGDNATAPLLRTAARRAPASPGQYNAPGCLRTPPSACNRHSHGSWHCATLYWPSRAARAAGRPAPACVDNEFWRRGEPGTVGHD